MATGSGWSPTPIGSWPAKERVNDVLIRGRLQKRAPNAVRLTTEGKGNDAINPLRPKARFQNHDRTDVSTTCDALDQISQEFRQTNTEHPPLFFVRVLNLTRQSGNIVKAGNQPGVGSQPCGLGLGGFNFVPEDLHLGSGSGIPCFGFIIVGGIGVVQNIAPAFPSRIRRLEFGASHGDLLSGGRSCVVQWRECLRVYES